MINLNAYQWLKIEPIDAWFFRDGRPSNYGEDQSDIVSEFPPNARTVVGALRAAIARENGWNGRGSWDAKLSLVLGNGDNLGKLSFLGPFLMKDEQLLWPLPQHVVGRFETKHQDRDQSETEHFVPTGLLQPSEELVACDVAENGVRFPVLPKPVAKDEHEPNAGPPAKPPKHPEHVWVTTHGMSEILSGHWPSRETCWTSGQLFVHESRVGIVRNPDSRTTERNAVYSPRYIRLRQGVSLVEGIAGLQDDNKAWNVPALLPLGGESRMAGVEILSTPEFPRSSKFGRRMVVLLSPARFEDSNWWGVGPGDDASKLSPTLSNGRIVTITIDRPRLIGGWSFEKGPLPLQPYVPPGSVWWLEDCTAEPGLVRIGAQSEFGCGLALISH